MIYIHLSGHWRKSSQLLVCFGASQVMYSKGTRHCITLPRFRHACAASFRQLESGDFVMYVPFYGLADMLLHVN